MFKSPAGMNDILPRGARSFQDIYAKAGALFELYGYEPIETPILEDVSLFNRSLGQETEIVQKQMFVVERKDESYCLRPEATASVARAYLENSLDKTSGFIKLYYTGPMFRAERPQKGRLRQFHHIGAEAIGSENPFLDSETIALADGILRALKITGYTIKLNSLGCDEDRKKLKTLLLSQLKDKLGKLCPDCNARYGRNVFRILDCKNEECRQITSQLDFGHKDYLCENCDAHFKTVRENLDALSIAYTVILTLVRGLDYYSRSVFEITHPGLGAQDAIGAGGRYDRLISELGGPDLGAVGFALGVERILLASDPQAQAFCKKTEVFMVTLGKEAKRQGFILLNSLRKSGISCDMDYENKSLKGQMRRANDMGVKYASILGDDELKKKSVTLKDMGSGKQEEISLDGLAEEIKRKICCAPTPAVN